MLSPVGGGWAVGARLLCSQPDARSGIDAWSVALGAERRSFARRHLTYCTSLFVRGTVRYDKLFRRRLYLMSTGIVLVVPPSLWIQSLETFGNCDVGIECG